ncbi:MAG: radical SAM protein [Mycobacterium sp.]|nr:radical SAM protein [Mycobacterium sp.]
MNTNCNLDCPICFADSGHQPDGYAITLEQCERMLDAFVAAEGEPEVLMFSGGEPTIHRQILDFVDAAQARPIGAVILNTNGIRLATDRRFVAELAARCGPGHHVGIYLQFDGFDERTHREIRGRDLREIKRRALDNCAEAGLAVTLVAAVERGLNDHELGAIIRHGIEHPAVRSVAFQPVTHAGRHVQFDPMTRITNSDVVHAIAEQLPEWFTASDFFPVPCCFPTCRSVTYLLTDGSSVLPIPRLLDVEDYLDYVSNRVVPDLGIREALEKLWSASAFHGNRDHLRPARPHRRGAGLRKQLRDRSARRVGQARRHRFRHRDSGLPGPLHAQCQAADEVLCRGDHPRWPADPVLRLQLGGGTANRFGRL